MEQKIYYFADGHLNHKNVIKFDGRPFETIEEMNKTIIDNWNERVKNCDFVYILGDLIWEKESEWANYLKRLNGQKILIRGNHDPKEFSKATRRYFLDVKDYKEITDNGRRVILSHYPILFYRADHNSNVYMLHGHVHETHENTLLEKFKQEIRDEFDPNNSGSNHCQIYNVGCSLPYMNYTPQTLDDIIEGYKKYVADESKYVKFCQETHL